MIGWWIIIRTQAQIEAGRDMRPPLPCLASWATNIGGTDWLDALVAANKAEGQVGAGYPNRYRAEARHVLPLIVNGPPPHESPAIIGDDYIMPANWTGQITINREAIEACAPDEMLLIEAWDQS